MGRAVVFAIVLTSSLLASFAQAQPYPAKPVRIVVGLAPGGLTDLLARITAQKLNEAWGQSLVVVDNRPGASGTIAAEMVSKAAPDGYTLLVSPQSSLAIAPSIYSRIPYDPLRDFAPVIEIGSSPLLLVVHPSLPSTFKAFVRLAQTRSAALSFGSGGLGTTPHLAGELLNLALGVRMVHVPYKGENPALADVIGGQLPFMFVNLPIGLPHVRAGKVRGLGIAAHNRTPLAPDIPTIAESGGGDIEAATWVALYAPAGTPREIVTRINADAAKALSSADARQRIAAQGVDLVAGTPEELAAFLKAETIKWAKVVRDSGARAE